MFNTTPVTRRFSSARCLTQIGRAYLAFDIHAGVKQPIFTAQFGGPGARQHHLRVVGQAAHC